MANPWFRMYAEFADDAKVQMMPEHMQRRLAMLMCLHSGSGKNEFQDAEIAFRMRITAADVSKTKALFLANGFIAQNWALVNWEKRQFLSDSSNERVRKHRAMKRYKGDECNGNETLHETPPEQNRTEQNRTDYVTALPTAISPSMAATAVMQQAGISGTELLRNLTDVLRAEQARAPDLEPIIAQMVAAHAEWEQAKPKLKYASGLAKFFGEGLWRDKATWPWKDGQQPPTANGRVYANAR